MLWYLQAKACEEAKTKVFIGGTETEISVWHPSTRCLANENLGDRVSVM